MEAGIVMPFAGSTAPQGWMLCDGAAISRTTYATLFSVIGTTYGEGDGETTFNIPNLSGRVVIGSSQSHALGTTGGSETVTLTADQLPSHVHEVPQHSHENNIAAKTPEFTHSITQPSYTYNAPKRIHKASFFSNAPFRSTSTATASRTTNVSVSAHSASDCTKGGSISKCDAFDSGSCGGGNPHNNMQPYTSVNYLICTGEI